MNKDEDIEELKKIIVDQTKQLEIANRSILELNSEISVLKSQEIERRKSQ